MTDSERLAEDLRNARARNFARLNKLPPPKPTPRTPVEHKNRFNAVLNAGNVIDLNAKEYRRISLSTSTKRLVSPERYFELFDMQQGACAICRKESPDKMLAVDHCHVEGHVRGLLCQTCNMALGMFKDKIDVLAKAIQYLSAEPNESKRQCNTSA